MRGLTGSGRGTLQAAYTAVAVLAALALFVSACGTGGTGARDEGPAHADSVMGAAATPTASPTPGSSKTAHVDAVKLVKDDPMVSAEVKRGLKPCVADEYPIEATYGKLTGGSADDIVVNVWTCGDEIGVGSYVYRERGGRYENVFQAEEPPVYAEIDRGDLVVAKQVYEKDDPMSSPSGEIVTTYIWASGHFVKRFNTRNEYGNAAGGDASPSS
ncbi:hypothetical protein ACFY1U_47495 [Streptomyces sp. NPDC001351]|uniref:hypothetical protein n=1 Tax=Streptomyces sp. NPDC001351 TaxID=3364564 RepID=UPI003689FA35